MVKIVAFRYFKNDLLGGITAGIVALPLALAFGEQSGLGAAAGLYGAAFIAFFASLLGGTPTQISGPTAPMTALSMVVVANIMQIHEGKLEEATPLIFAVFLCAGLIQILLGVLKLGSYIKYIPYTVVSGFMTGIGIIIIITQIPLTLGYNVVNDQKVVDSFLPNAEELILDRILREEAQDNILVLEDFKETIKRAEHITHEDIQVEAITLASNDAKGVLGAIKYLPKAWSHIRYTELILTLLTILVIYGFRRITKLIPSTLAALLLLSGGAYAWGIEYVPIQEIPFGYPTFHTEVFFGFHLASFIPYLVSALLLALLGTFDSLLTSVVADNLTQTRHKPNQELIGQGVGNGIAALFGGLPGAGATIRTVVNIQAGGKTKLSGMVTGILLFIILTLLGPLASKIPAAVLTGILITVGIGVMDYKGLKALPKMEWAEKVILLSVLVLTVFWQLIYAVGMGMIFATFVFLKRMSDSSSDNVEIHNLKHIQKEDPLWEDETILDPEIRDRIIFKHLSGPVFFGFATRFIELADNFSGIHLLVIRMERVPFMDQSGVYALETGIKSLYKKGIIVVLSGANDQVMKILHDMKIVPTLIPEKTLFKNFSECTKWLRKVLNEKGGLEEETKLIQARKD